MTRSFRKTFGRRSRDKVSIGQHHVQPQIRNVKTITKPITHWEAFSATPGYLSGSTVGNELIIPFASSVKFFAADTSIPLNYKRFAIGYNKATILASKLELFVASPKHAHDGTNKLLLTTDGPNTPEYLWIACRPATDTFVPPETVQELFDLDNVKIHRFKSHSNDPDWLSAATSLYCTVGKAFTDLNKVQIMAAPEFHGGITQATGTYVADPTIATHGWVYYYGIMTRHPTELNDLQPTIWNAKLTQYVKYWDRQNDQ